MGGNAEPGRPARLRVDQEAAREDGGVALSSPLRVPALAVVGGGADGLFYVRQLLRARAAGRLETERVIVVDRDAGCAVAKAVADERVTLAVADWSDWLDAELLRLPAGAHLVPYHWAPHLLLEWLARQAARAGRMAWRAGPAPAGSWPYAAETRAGDRALSYATWPCPPTCIEPALCPHTRGARDWSLHADLERDGESLVFRCLHLVYGVGTIPVDEILASRERLLATPHGRRFVVATSSHCHALATHLEIAGAG